VHITTLGRSGLRVSCVALGCGGFGTRVGGQDAVGVVHAALDAGVTFFDTADVYGAGESERLLGQALRGRHDTAVIATKFRHWPAARGASRKSIRVAVENSLRRLDVDYIDLYQLHAPDPVTPLAETIGALQDLVHQGKILYFGLGNLSAQDLGTAADLAGTGGPVSVTSAQAQMNLVDTSRLDELSPVAARTGVGLLAASPLARGLLSGRYHADVPPPAGHPLLSSKGIGYWNAAGVDTAARVREVAAEHGMAPAEAALCAVLDHPQVSAVVVGATSAEQIAQHTAVRPGRLDRDALRRLRGASTPGARPAVPSDHSPRHRSRGLSVSNAINFEELASAKLNEEPFPWAFYGNALKNSNGLIDTFPTTGFAWHSQRQLLENLGKKGSEAWYQHSVATRALLELGETRPHEPSELDDQWLAFADDLLSAEYRDALSELTGCDVRQLRMQAHFWRFEEGSFFQPHVDKAHKVVTHLMYLTKDWTADMGGCFRVLSSDDPEDVHTEIPPLPNNSIVLRRTDNAWHSVSAVPRGSGRTRRLLQVWFWG
jgi:aryl-alcohol dehydrogenase-like predicted oxidoreductase